MSEVRGSSRTENPMISILLHAQMKVVRPCLTSAYSRGCNLKQVESPNDSINGSTHSGLIVGNCITYSAQFASDRTETGITGYSASRPARKDGIVGYRDFRAAVSPPLRKLIDPRHTFAGKCERGDCSSIKRSHTNLSSGRSRINEILGLFSSKYYTQHQEPDPLPTNPPQNKSIQEKHQTKHYREIPLKIEHEGILFHKRRPFTPLILCLDPVLNA